MQALEKLQLVPPPGVRAGLEGLKTGFGQQPPVAPGLAVDEAGSRADKSADSTELRGTERRMRTKLEFKML